LHCGYRGAAGVAALRPAPDDDLRQRVRGVVARRGGGAAVHVEGRRRGGGVEHQPGLHAAGRPAEWRRVPAAAGGRPHRAGRALPAARHLGEPERRAVQRVPPHRRSDT